MWILGGSGVMAILGIIAFRISRKFMGFVSLAESIFWGFGWTDVRNIDLPAITKASKKAVIRERWAFYTSVSSAHLDTLSIAVSSLCMHLRVSSRIH